MKVVYIKEIKYCWRQCPYYGIDGGPGPVMTCEHPEAPQSGYIISHPECTEGFPELCPLVKQEKHVRRQRKIKSR